MSPISSISLLPLGHADEGKITRLYRYLELYSEGTPPHNSIFVFAPATGPLDLGSGARSDDQLLIVDPPTDLSTRFKVGDQTAVLFTSAPTPVTVPLLQTQPGGLAHIRIGEHFLDIYSQQHGALVHLPALGILCGGNFGSDSTVPQLAEGSDGSDELETLRLLARLVKQHRLSLYIPRVGNELTDKVVVMEKLAGDVGYINNLRRAITPLIMRGESLEAVNDVAERALPSDRRTPLALTTHEQNVTTLVAALMR